MKDKNKIGFGIMLGSLLSLLIMVMVGNDNGVLCIIPLILGALMYN